LQIYQFYEAGVEETPNAEVRAAKCQPTIVRGMLFLPASGVERGASSVLGDVSGRKVLDLQPGPNDVSRLAPGVYFVRERSAAGGRRSAVSVRKVVVTR